MTRTRLIISILFAILLCVSHPCYPQSNCTPPLKILGTRSLKPRWIDALLASRVARFQLADVLASAHKNPGQSVALGLFYANQFKPQGFKVPWVARKPMRILPGLESLADSNAFRQYAIEHTNLDVVQVLQQIAIEAPTIPLGEILRHGDFREIDKSLESVSGPLRRRLTSLLVSYSNYRKAIIEDFSNSIRNRVVPHWEALAGLPILTNFAMLNGREIRPFPMGTILEFPPTSSVSHVEIVSYIGRGGEHMVYHALLPDGNASVLKVIVNFLDGGQQDKADQASQMVRARLPVLKIQRLVRGYYLVERYLMDGNQELWQSMSRLEPPLSMKPYLEIYRRYLNSQLIIPDLKMGNLARMEDGSVKIGDWLTVMTEADAKGVWSSPQRKRNQLALEIAESFGKAMLTPKHDSVGEPSTWRDQQDRYLNYFIEELGLEDVRDVIANSIEFYRNFDPAGI